MVMDTDMGMDVITQNLTLLNTQSPDVPPAIVAELKFLMEISDLLLLLRFVYYCACVKMRLLLSNDMVPINH